MLGYIGAISRVEGADGALEPRWSLRHNSSKTSPNTRNDMFWPSRWIRRKSPTWKLYRNCKVLHLILRQTLIYWHHRLCLHNALSSEPQTLICHIFDILLMWKASMFLATHAMLSYRLFLSFLFYYDDIILYIKTVTYYMNAMDRQL